MPLKFPQFYQARDVTAFRSYYDQAFPAADLVVVSSRAVERDIVGYCAEHRLRLNRTEVVPLGTDAAQASSPPPMLPEGLERARVVLLVSTIEPRKGHRLMYEVWLRLLAEGVPQRTGFKLVFVGRPGWMVDELMANLSSDTRLAGTLRVLPFASDDELAALYDAAAFCVYPSVYEGYGLPVVEAFARGKAVIASNGGALAETVGDLSPCLDPHDQEAWYVLMKRWILEPDARAPYEAAIRGRFRARSWRETAGQFLRIVDSFDAA
jgi:glycosyltransferase involved in cell wall biosynthesis